MLDELPFFRENRPRLLRKQGVEGIEIKTS
jgi:hypothetical protein